MSELVEKKTLRKKRSRIFDNFRGFNVNRDIFINISIGDKPSKESPKRCDKFLKHSVIKH